VDGGSLGVGGQVRMGGASRKMLITGPYIKSALRGVVIYISSNQGAKGKKAVRPFTSRPMS
jgi:hypothetical protein